MPNLCHLSVIRPADGSLGQCYKRIDLQKGSVARRSRLHQLDSDLVTNGPSEDLGIAL
jgi:hypothetical protein